MDPTSDPFASLFGTVDLSNSAQLLPSASTPAPIPTSVLDTGGAPTSSSTDWGATLSGALNSLLNTYTTTQAIQTAAQYGAAPGYIRVPGSTQVVPAGTYPASAIPSSNGNLVIVLIVAGVLLFALRKG